MLIVRAPVRISFAGGGTDMPAYYEEYGGLVISTSINKYFYVLVNQLGVGDSQIISADYQSLFSISQAETETGLIWDGNLALPKAVLAQFGVQSGENIFISCEVPPGTGLGSSSAAAVGLVTALSHQRGLRLSKQEIAEIACQIEIERLQMPIGKQDQYASALGGLNQLTFAADGVHAERLNLSGSARKTFEAHLMLFFTGVSRKSTSILKEQKASIQHFDRAVLDNLHYLKELAVEVRRCLEQARFEDFGRLLDEGWQRKKQLSPNIANSAINDTYEAARVAGASGGKITGAGGGGFLMLYCEPERQPAVAEAMRARGLSRMNFQFDNQGAHILLDHEHEG